MPHQCVRCGKIYDDGAQEILKGCGCGARLFFYIKKEKLEALKSATINLTPEEKVEIEKDVIEMIGAEEAEKQPVVLDFESIRVSKPGKYELDLVKIFKEEPIVYKIEEGKYVIDVASAFQMHPKRKR